MSAPAVPANDATVIVYDLLRCPIKSEPKGCSACLNDAITIVRAIYYPEQVAAENRMSASDPSVPHGVTRAALAPLLQAVAPLLAQVKRVEDANRAAIHEVPEGALICLQYAEAKALLHAVRGAVR